MKINKAKLYQNLKNIETITNIKIIFCYKVLFSISGISNNIGFYIVMSIIIFFIISIFIFYKKQAALLKNDIKDIVNAVIQEDKNANNTELNKDIISIAFRKNDAKKIKIKKKIKMKMKVKKRNNNKDIFNLNNNELIKKIIIDSNNYENIENEPQIENLDNIFEDNKTSIKLRREKENKISKYNDEQLNDLSYDSALKYDKRTYSEYYISLIIIKHKILFTFFYKDYNSRIIKINLFFISFITSYAINALFFTDGTMHQIYVDQGDFNIEYLIPQILYSSLISYILDCLIKFLAQSNQDILKLKKIKTANEVIDKEKNLNKKLCIKFILFFIIGFIYLIVMWYYISIFCAIYKNTQLHLIKETVISFLLRFIYPFAIYLLPGIFRTISLSDPKKKEKYYTSLEKYFNFKKLLIFVIDIVLI